MTTIILVSTLCSLATILYVYIGYPILLSILNVVINRKPIQQDENFLPKVTLLISCYNEIDVVKQKIENSLAIDYPQDKLEIIIISDGSDDGTDDIAKSFSDRGVKLIRQEGRLGKTSAINLAMEQVNSEIVVFSDANAMYLPNAITKLIRNFAEKDVGYVVGAALYTDGKTSAAAASEDIYWQYEIKLKTLESAVHSVVGGDGAIYAIRRALYIPLDAKDINDFVNPLQIIEQGYRGVFDHEANCLEETAGDFAKEAKRKQRIVNRSFRGLMKVKAVMNPFKYGFFSLEVISHKLLRWLIPVFITCFAIGSILSAYQNIFSFQIISLLGICFLWLAQVGFIKSNQQAISPAFFLPYYFLMVNYYSLIGVITALLGNIQVTWSTPRVSDNKQTKLNTKSIAVLSLTNIALVSIFYDIFSLIS